jgi:zinc protease
VIRAIVAAAFALLLALPAHSAVEIQEVTSPGGIKAWLVEERSIPFAAIEIRFRGGTSLDEPGKEGAVNLMTGLIEEGAGDMDAQAFAEARESLAASFEFDAAQDGVSVSARFLTENRDEAVALLREALVALRFDEDAVERVRAQVLSGLRSDATDPNEIASRTFNTLAYGGHPYARASEGTIDSVTRLTRDDIAAAHAATMTRDRIYVGAVGDIGPEELGALLDTLLGDLPAEGAPLPGEAEFLLPGGVSVVPFDTPQSVALFGHSGIPRDDPDFFAAFVANEIFGGSGFQSRLMEEVRVKRGLTYGIGAWLVNNDRSDLVLGQVASANDRMAETLEVVRAEWARIAAEGVTQEELDSAKTYLTGAYPLRFDGNGTIARILVGMQMDGLPIDYIETRNDKVNAVTLADIERVVKRIYRPEDLHLVVVGQPAGVEATN